MKKLVMLVAAGVLALTPFVSAQAEDHATHGAEVVVEETVTETTEVVVDGEAAADASVTEVTVDAVVVTDEEGNVVVEETTETTTETTVTE